MTEKGAKRQLDKETKQLGVSAELVDTAASVLGEDPARILDKLRKTVPIVENSPDGRASYTAGLQRNMALQEEIDDKLYENLVTMTGFCYIEELDMVMTVEGPAGFILGQRGQPTPFICQKARTFVRFLGDDPRERPKGPGKTPLIRLCLSNGKSATQIKSATEKAARSCHVPGTWRKAEFPIKLDKPVENDHALQILIRHGFASVVGQVTGKSTEEECPQENSRS